MKRRGKLSIPDDQYNFLWVEEFPLFSFESASPGEAKRIVTTHHPFTAPHPDDIDLLMSSDAEHDLLRVRYARVRSCVCDACVSHKQFFIGSPGVCTTTAWSMA